MLRTCPAVEKESNLGALIMKRGAIRSILSYEIVSAGGCSKGAPSLQVFHPPLEGGIELEPGLLVVPRFSLRSKAT